MEQGERIDQIIVDAIGIIELEVIKIKNSQTTKPLDAKETDKVIEFVKALVIVRKDWRQEVKDEVVNTKNMTDEELEKELLKEAAKILKV